MWSSTRVNMPRVSGKFIRLLVIIVPVAVFGVWYLGGFKSPYDKEKMKLVLDMTEKIPLHPTFREAGSEQLANSKTITITRYYSSSMGWAEVKQYYLDLLTRDNWKLVQQNHMLGPEEMLPKKLRFIKQGSFDVSFADLFFSVEYEGGTRKPGRDYILEYAWDTAEYRTQNRRLQLATVLTGP
jgi:hypothetical protein